PRAARRRAPRAGHRGSHAGRGARRRCCSGRGGPGRRRSTRSLSSQEAHPAMATMNTQELLDVFKNMTVLELNEFLKAFEEEFGVTAAAPVALAPASAGLGDGAAPA